MNLMVLALGACLQASVPAGGTCASCHGDGASDPAPPAALGGITDRAYPGVGAHQVHLSPSRAVPVACSECHLVPRSIDAPGHLDTPWPAEVRWGELAGLRAEPFEHDALTCTVYCHTAADAADPEPSWTQPGPMLCTSCHGNPPDSRAHDRVTDSCAPCHVRDAATQHVDGELQVITVCGTCHGSPEDPSPPPDTLGETDTTLTSVGAHEAHVTGGDFSAPVPCETCHVVPTSVLDPTHIDEAPAEVRPEVGWDGATCTNPCHAGSGGGTVPNPVWTQVDGTQDACGACHGLGPPPPHPGGTLCDVCHPQTAGPDQTVAFPDNHVNGVLELD